MSFIGYAFMVYAFAKYYRLLSMVLAKILISFVASFHGLVFGNGNEDLVGPDHRHFKVHFVLLLFFNLVCLYDQPI